MPSIFKKSTLCRNYFLVQSPTHELVFYQNWDMAYENLYMVNVSKLTNDYHVSLHDWRKDTFNQVYEQKVHEHLHESALRYSECAETRQFADYTDGHYAYLDTTLLIALWIGPEAANMVMKMISYAQECDNLEKLRLLQVENANLAKCLKHVSRGESTSCMILHLGCNTSTFPYYLLVKGSKEICMCVNDMMAAFPGSRIVFFKHNIANTNFASKFACNKHLFFYSNYFSTYLPEPRLVEEAEKMFTCEPPLCIE
jgi:hypothetical protein